MPDNDKSLPQVPESKVVAKKRARISLVWVIPIVAAVAGVWIAATRILGQGPAITLTFESAEGLEAGKTKINFNGLDIGKLTDIRLAPDRKHVLATAQMEPKTEEFLVKDTKFWVVRPRVSGLNITGLGTLISGHYIGVEPGQSRESARKFVALDEPPMVAGNTPGRFFTLKTSELGSLGKGAPIYFRRLRAGQIVSHELDPDGQSLSVRVFVESPYDRFVTANTRFWHASGIDMSVSANGLHVQTESLLSILAGGIAFETPAADAPQPPAGADTVFTLFNDRADAFKPAPRNPHSFLLVFKQSVRGLEPGAPVAMHGVTIGEVTAVRAQFDEKTFEFNVPVTISVDAERYGVKFIDLQPGENLAAANKAMMDALVARGLRAQLKTGNLISGALYVAVDFFPDAPPASLDWSLNPPQLPTVPGQLEGIEASIASIIRKLDQMEFKEISADVRKTFGELDQTLASVRGTLTNTDKLLGNASSLVEPNSALIGGLDGMLQEAGSAARALRELADYLERHPEALIRGKKGEAQ